MLNFFIFIEKLCCELSKLHLEKLSSYLLSQALVQENI